VLNAAAYVATWCRTEFGRTGVDGPPGAELEALAELVPIGAEDLLTVPYWNAAQTPYWDPVARGVTVGWHGRHTRAHLYRSILEGVGYELRLHLERLEAVTGEPIRSIRVVGGGSRSPLWVRIVADVTGRPVLVCADAEWSAAGAAALARAYLARTAGGGSGGSLAEIGEPDGRDVVPDPVATNRYGAFAVVHRRLYPALRDVFPELVAAAADGEDAAYD
jgi:xylulokinase